MVFTYANFASIITIMCTRIGTRFAVFSMKAAELQCQNLIVKKVCQVEHFKGILKAKMHFYRISD